jgi:glycosyltransferase involved in cell wall biosynthesis
MPQNVTAPKTTGTTREAALRGTRPAVSVVMSVWNAEAYVAESIESVLRQSFGDFELLIIDDGSSDRSAAIIARYAATDSRIRVLQNDSNLGLPASLNRGLQEARGELIARHDADDRSFRERLQKQVSFLRDHEEVVILGTQARVIDARGRTVRASDAFRACTPLGVRWQMLLTNPFFHGSVMFRRDVVRDCGGYDSAVRYGEDYELWSRILPARNGANLPDVLLEYRVHDRSMGGQLGRRAGAPGKSPSDARPPRKSLNDRTKYVEAVLGETRLSELWPPLFASTEWPAHHEVPIDLRDVMAASRRSIRLQHGRAMWRGYAASTGGGW